MSTSDITKPDVTSRKLSDIDDREMTHIIRALLTDIIRTWKTDKFGDIVIPSADCDPNLTLYSLGQFSFDYYPTKFCTLEDLTHIDDYAFSRVAPAVKFFFVLAKSNPEMTLSEALSTVTSDPEFIGLIGRRVKLARRCIIYEAVHIYMQRMKLHSSLLGNLMSVYDHDSGCSTFWNLLTKTRLGNFTMNCKYEEISNILTDTRAVFHDVEHVLEYPTTVVRALEVTRIVMSERPIFGIMLKNSSNTHNSDQITIDNQVFNARMISKLNSMSRSAKRNNLLKQYYINEFWGKISAKISDCEDRKDIISMVGERVSDGIESLKGGLLSDYNECIEMCGGEEITELTESESKFISEYYEIGIIEVAMALFTQKIITEVLGDDVTSDLLNCDKHALNVVAVVRFMVSEIVYDSYYKLHFSELQNNSTTDHDFACTVDTNTRIAMNLVKHIGEGHVEDIEHIGEGKIKMSISDTIDWILKSVDEIDGTTTAIRDPIVTAVSNIYWKGESSDLKYVRSKGMLNELLEYDGLIDYIDRRKVREIIVINDVTKLER